MGLGELSLTGGGRTYVIRSWVNGTKIWPHLEQKLTRDLSLQLHDDDDDDGFRPEFRRRLGVRFQLQNNYFRCAISGVRFSGVRFQVCNFRCAIFRCAILGVRF